MNIQRGTKDGEKRDIGRSFFSSFNPEFRLYGPLDPWFDKTWRPSEIELVE
jgi:hypothetical protein